MDRTRWTLIALIVLLSVTAFTAVAAQGSPSIDRHIITSGSQPLADGDVVLISVVGETVGSGMVGAGDVEVNSGFMQDGMGIFRRWLADMLRSE